MKSNSGLSLLFTTSYDGTASMFKLHSKAFTRSGNKPRGGELIVENSNSSGGGGGHVFQRLAVMQGMHHDKVLSGCVVPWTQEVITTGADGKVAKWGIPNDLDKRW